MLRGVAASALRYGGSSEACAAPRRMASSLSLTKEEKKGKRIRSAKGLRNRENEARDDVGRVDTEKKGALRATWEREHAEHRERGTGPIGFNQAGGESASIDEAAPSSQLENVERLRMKMANRDKSSKRNTKRAAAEQRRAAAEQEQERQQQQQQSQPPEDDDDPLADIGDIPGSPVDKFVDAEIMKMEARVIKAATRKEARRAMKSVTAVPAMELFKFNKQYVPPPPALTNILVPSAVELGHKVYVQKEWELVYQGGPYDVYLDSGPASASEIALFGAAGCGKSSLINAITESKVANTRPNHGGVQTIDFYQAPDPKLWRQAWADGPTKYPAATRLSRTHWGGALIDLPGHTKDSIRPDSDDSFYGCISQYFEGTRRQLKGTFYCIDATVGFTMRDRHWLKVLADMHTRVSLVTIVLTKADLVSHANLSRLMKEIYKEVSGSRFYSMRVNYPIIPVSSVYGWGIDQLRGYLATQAELLPWWKRVEEQRDIVESMSKKDKDEKEAYLEERLRLVHNFKKLDKWNDQVHRAINASEYGSADEATEAEYALVKLEKEQEKMGMHASGMGARFNPQIKNPYVPATMTGGGHIGPGMSPTTIDSYIASVKPTAPTPPAALEDDTRLEEIKKEKETSFLQRMKRMQDLADEAVAYPSAQQQYQRDFFERQMGEWTDARRGVTMYSPTYMTDPEITKEDWETLATEDIEKKILRGTAADPVSERMRYGFTLDDIRDDVRGNAKKDGDTPAEGDAGDVSASDYIIDIDTTPHEETTGNDATRPTPSQGDETHTAHPPAEPCSETAPAAVAAEAEQRDIIDIDVSVEVEVVPRDDAPAVPQRPAGREAAEAEEDRVEEEEGYAGLQLSDVDHLIPGTPVGFEWMMPRGKLSEKYPMRCSFALRLSGGAGEKPGQAQKEQLQQQAQVDSAADVMSLADAVLFDLDSGAEAGPKADGELLLPEGGSRPYRVASNVDSPLAHSVEAARQRAEKAAGGAAVHPSLSEEGLAAQALAYRIRSTPPGAAGAGKPEDWEDAVREGEAERLAESFLPLKGASGSLNVMAADDTADAAYDAAAQVGIGLSKTDQTHFKDTPVSKPSVSGGERKEEEAEAEGVEEEKGGGKGGDPHGSALPRPSQKWRTFTQLLNSVPSDVLLEAQPVPEGQQVYKPTWSEPTTGAAIRLNDGLGKNNEPTLLSKEVIAKEIKEKQMGPHYMGFPWMSHDQLPSALQQQDEKKAQEVALASFRSMVKNTARVERYSLMGPLIIRPPSVRVEKRHERERVEMDYERAMGAHKNKSGIVVEVPDITTGMIRYQAVKGGKIEGPLAYTKTITRGLSQGLFPLRRLQVLQRDVHRGVMDEEDLEMELTNTHRHAASSWMAMATTAEQVVHAARLRNGESCQLSFSSKGRVSYKYIPRPKLTGDKGTRLQKELRREKERVMRPQSPSRVRILGAGFAKEKKKAQWTGNSKSGGGPHNPARPPKYSSARHRASSA